MRCDTFYHYFTSVIAFPYRLQQFLGGVFDTVTPDPVPGPITDSWVYGRWVPPHSVALVTRSTSGQPFSFPSELSADSSLAHCTTSSVFTQTWANALECAKTRDDRQNDQHSENPGRTGLTGFADMLRAVLTQNRANTLECARTRDDRQNDQHSENLGRTGLTGFADRCRQGTRKDLEQRARERPRRSSRS